MSRAVCTGGRHGRTGNAFTDFRRAASAPHAGRSVRRDPRRAGDGGARLFAAQGFAEVSTDAIVAAAGVTRGALYHQFADKTALFDAVLDAVEADIARRLAEELAAAGISDPIEGMRHSLRTWLDICVEPEIHRIALIDGPSVVGWAHWREVCQRHVFGLAQALLPQRDRSGAHPSAAGAAARARPHGGQRRGRPVRRGSGRPRAGAGRDDRHPRPAHRRRAHLTLES